MATQRVMGIRQLFPDFVVTEDDMKQPTTEFVMKLLDRILEELGLLDLTYQEYLSDKMLNPAAAKEGSRKIIVCKIFKHIFAKINGPPFGIEDIIESEPKYFGKRVDILLNLIRYLEFHLALVFNKVMNEMGELPPLKEALAKEIDSLTEKYNGMAMEKKAVTSQLKSGHMEREKYKAIQDKVKEKAMEMKTERDELNSIQAEGAAEIAALEAATQKEKEEMEAIKGNIVMSPDAVSRERVELLNKREELDDQRASLMNAVEERKHFSSKLEHLCSSVDSVPALIKDLSEKVTYSRNLERGFHIDEVNCQNAAERHSAAVKYLENTRKEIAGVLEEEERLKRKHMKICASLENELLQANRAKQEAEEEQIKKGAEQVLFAQEIELLKEKKSSLEEKEEILNKNFLSKKQQIENIVVQFHQKVQRKVKNLKKRLGMVDNERED